jgi:nucleoside-diphosphate-sugar epimerase
MNYWTGKRVLVTGGAGFIGHRLVGKLVDLGANVVVVDDLSKGTTKNLEKVSGKIQFRNEDLLRAETARELLENTEVCFHLAAKIGGIGYFHKTPAQSLRDNSIMNFNLWDAAVGNDIKMVCLSSSMVFERTSVFPTTESALQNSPPPVTGYGFSKLVAEYIARTYHDQFDTRYIIVRPFNAYGPGEMPGDYVGYAHVIPDLIRKILSDQYPLEILGSGNQTRSYTYVDDIAEAIIYVTERRENDDFNIGTGIETSVLQLARKLWDLCGRKQPFAVRTIEKFEHDVEKRVPDVSKIVNLGWKPRVDLDEGLQLTVNWLRSQSNSYADV